MRRASARDEPETQRPAGCERQPIVGRLAIDEKVRPGRRQVRGAGAVAAALFAHHEQQADTRLARAAQPIGCRHLRGQDAFRVARSTSDNPPALETTGKERGHAVEVRGQDDLGITRSGDHIEPAVVDRLFGDVEADAAKVIGQPAAGICLPAGRRIDVDQRTRYRDQVYLIHASSSVRVSVRESRYFTITGVASDSPHSGPFPAATARAPGTTTAPSGTTRGRSAVGLMTSPFTRSYTGVDPV